MEQLTCAMQSDDLSLRPLLLGRVSGVMDEERGTLEAAGTGHSGGGVHSLQQGKQNLP